VANKLKNEPERKKAASGRRWMPPISFDWFREEVEPISGIEDRGNAASAQ
jgi:hypothetical protein